MKIALSLLEPIDYHGVAGYSMRSIKKALGSVRFKKFLQWISGQTVGIKNGETIVYRHDLERFINGLPPID